MKRRHLFGLLGAASVAPLLPKAAKGWTVAEHMTTYTPFTTYGAGEYVYDHKYVFRTYGIEFDPGPFGPELNAMIERRERDAINSLTERIFAEDLRGPWAASGGGDAGGAPEVGEAERGLPDRGWLSWTQDLPGSAPDEEG